MLRSLIRKEPGKAEAYVILWNYYYYKGQFGPAEDLAE